MLIFLYGADTFCSRAQMKKMIEKFKKDRDPQGYNTVVLDAKTTEMGKILGEILATPFLADKRMLVIENVLTAKKKDLTKELLKKIEENSLPEANVIIFWDEGEEFKDKDAKLLFDRLLKEKYAQHFEEFKGVKLSAWIDAEVKERGGKIDRQATQFLAENINGDMWRLNSIIDQLIAYCHCEQAVERPPHPAPLSSPATPRLRRASEEREIIKVPSPHGRGQGEGSLGGTISLTDVKLFLPEKVDDSIFNLVDAIVAKQPKNVFKMIQEQYRKGEDATFIFAMILRQFRIILELRDLFDREDNLPSDIIAKRLSLHPFVVKKSLPLIKRYSLDELKKIYHQLLEIDIKTKTGRGDQEILLDLFVGQLAV